MSVRKWEDCGVETALMELDVVHNRQYINSERNGKEEGDGEGERKTNMAERVTDFHKP